MRTLIVLLALLGSATLQAEVLRIYNWKDYIEPQLLERFQHDTGITLEYRTYTTAQELEQALGASGQAGFDLVVPSHFQLEALIAQGLVQPIDRRQLPHYRNLEPKLLASLASYARAERHAVPYLWSTVGLVVDRPALDARLGSAASADWSLLFDEAQMRRLRDCGLGWLDAPEETFSLRLNWQGRRLDRTSARALSKTGEELRLTARQLRALDNEAYIDALAGGRLCAAMAWSGHAIAAATRRPSLEFVVPAEGGLLTLDAWAIPRDARQPALAHRFIDYMLQAAHARQNSLATHFYPPLRADLPELVELAGQVPQLVPDSAQRRRLYFLEPLQEDQQQALQQAWRAIAGEVRQGRSAPTEQR